MPDCRLSMPVCFARRIIIKNHIRDQKIRFHATSGSIWMSLNECFPRLMLRKFGFPHKCCIVNPTYTFRYYCNASVFANQMCVGLWEVWRTSLCANEIFLVVVSCRFVPCEDRFAAFTGSCIIFSFRGLWH